MTTELFVGHPFAFHVRYSWQREIDVVVETSQVDADLNRLLRCPAAVVSQSQFMTVCS